MSVLQCCSARAQPHHAQDVAILQVLDYELQRQLEPYMKDLQPLPGIYDPDFIAANQDSRADNLIKGNKKAQMETVRQQIRDFQKDSGVDKVIVLWTANTERYSEVCHSSACRLPIIDLAGVLPLHKLSSCGLMWR